MMLQVAFWLLSAAVIAGLGLIAVYLKGEDGPRLPVWAGIGHGLIGTAGFLVLLPTLPMFGGPPRGLASGSGSFGTVAAAFVAGAILAGAVVLAATLRRRKVSAVVLATHAMLGVGGYVMLAAYYAG